MAQHEYLVSFHDPPMMRKLDKNYSLDMILERKTPQKDKYYELTRTADENIARALKPDEAEQDEIAEILNRPEFLLMEEKHKSIIWQFRYSLKDNGSALVKFLQSARLEDEREKEEAMRLFNSWGEISLEDALPLLSIKFAANSFYREDIDQNKELNLPEVYNNIRTKAVRCLEKQSTKIITSIML